MSLNTQRMPATSSVDSSRVEEFMLELNNVCEAAYIYLCSVERSSWAPLFFDFNPLDNVTSNDAESVIASFTDEKNEGDILGCFTGTLYKEAEKLYRAMKTNENVTGLFAYQVLQDAYEARMAEAHQMLKVSQTDRDIMVVAHGNYPSTTYLVNLSNLPNDQFVFKASETSGVFLIFVFEV